MGTLVEGQRKLYFIYYCWSSSLRRSCSTMHIYIWMLQGLKYFGCPLVPKLVLLSKHIIRVIPFWPLNIFILSCKNILAFHEHYALGATQTAYLQGGNKSWFTPTIRSRAFWNFEGKPLTTYRFL